MAGMVGDATHRFGPGVAVTMPHVVATKLARSGMKFRLAMAVTAAFAAALAVPAVAHADVAAVYAEGHGGLESGGATPPNGASPGGVGFRVGARLLIFEGYYDYTDFGGSAAVSRGILGLRGGFGTRRRASRPARGRRRDRRTGRRVDGERP